MPRESRFDFRGGVNLRFTEDTMDQTEFRVLRNARAEQYGGVAKRSGTRRVHDTALGAPVLGLYHWRGPAGDQTVAVAGGNLHHKLPADVNFTSVTSDFSTTYRPSFARHVRSGSPRLFIGDGKLRKWTGSVLSTVTGTGVPDALEIEVYKERMFATDGTKTLYWSSVENPEDWTLAEGGGQAFVETFDTEGIVGLGKVGGSLLVFKENSIARYTGVTSADIRIERDTEGISADIGCVAPRSIVRMEGVVFFLSDRGPYIASESGVQAIGVKVEPAFQAVNHEALRNAVSVHNKARQEILVMIPPVGGSDLAQGWLFNYRMNNWAGPWEFSWASTTAATEFERADRTESVLVAGSDGWVREGDVPEVTGKDDAPRTGAGGDTVAFEATFAAMLMGDPSAVKTAHRPQHIAAVMEEHGIMEVTTSGDTGPTQTAILAARRGSGEVPTQYRFRNAWRGRRPVLSIAENTTSTFQLNGLIVEMDMGRSIV